MLSFRRLIKKPAAKTISATNRPPNAPYNALCHRLLSALAAPVSASSCAAFAFETTAPNNSCIAINAVDRQTFLRRSYKIDDEVNQQSLSWTFSVSQDLEALLVQLLQRNLAPNCDEPIRNATSVRHLHDAWRCGNAARISLYLVVGFSPLEKCCLLITIDASNVSLT